MTSFSIQSFGCRVNQAEAFQWVEELQKHGLKYEKDYFQSDLVLVNTCTITSRADRDVRGFINKLKRKNPRARMVVTGCYVERASEELENIPQIWKIFPNREKEELALKILSWTGSEKQQINLPFRSRALVKIQDGCDFRCAFCIIPFVRGKSVSCGKEKILKQAKEFTKQGFREIVLTGVHLCLYGRDMRQKSSLMALLNELEDIDGLGRIRLSSLDPRFLDAALLNHITSSAKICPHFHLSLQYGSDRVLLRMGRKIRASQYQETLDYLRKRIPGASLGAEIMVGFPGESESDFEKTYRFLEKSPLTYFHVFSFSSRPGTAASAWPQIPDRVKTERSALLRKLSKDKNRIFRNLFIGKECNAIVIKKETKGTQVLTPNYINVSLPSCPTEEKEEVMIRITKVTDKRTHGQILFKD